MGCPPRSGAGYPSLPPLQHRGPAFSLPTILSCPYLGPPHGVGRFSFGPPPDLAQAAEAGWNCSSSVEPLSADSELNEPEITWFTVSK